MTIYDWLQALDLSMRYLLLAALYYVLIAYPWIKLAQRRAER